METPSAVWEVERVNSAPVISHIGAACVCVYITYICTYTYDFM